MRSAIALALFISTSVALSSPGQQAQKADTQKPDNPNVNATAATQQDFQKRLDEYLALRKKVMEQAPKPKQSNNPAEINAAENYLADSIRAARANAKQGDLFTPEVQATFRKLLAPELKGEDGEHAKKVLKDDAPPTAAVPLKVNARYPDGKSFPSVPSNLLLNLPKLPMEVEYRIIGKNLILRDTGADIIVDYMLNAIK